MDVTYGGVRFHISHSDRQPEVIEVAILKNGVLVSRWEFSIEQAEALRDMLSMALDARLEGTERPGEIEGGEGSWAIRRE